MIDNIKDIWDEFLKYPLVIKTIILSILIITIAITGMYLSAFTQGCNISFWPPSIEKCPRPDNPPVNPSPNSNIKKWEGQWIGEVNDLHVPGEEETLDSETRLNQKLNINIKQERERIILTGDVSFRNRDGRNEFAKVEGEGNPQRHPDYIIVNYKSKNVDGTNETFGTAFMHLDGLGRSMKGYLLTQRIFGNTDQAFGKVELQRIQ